MLWQICSQVSGQLLVGVPNFRLLPWFIVWGRFNVPTLQTAQPWARNQLNIKCKTGKDALPTPSTPSHPCLNTPPPLGRLISGTKSKKGRGGGGQRERDPFLCGFAPLPWIQLNSGWIILTNTYSSSLSSLYHHSAAFNDDEVCQYYTKKTRRTLRRAVMLQITILNDTNIVTIKGGQNLPTWWHFVRCQFSGGHHLPGGAAADLLLTPS